jgi:hypothetical protein
MKTLKLTLVSFFYSPYLKKKMVTLDKRLTQQRLILTVSEKPIASGNELLLTAENKGTNQNFQIFLPANSSMYKRYDEFIFPTTEITNWLQGQYVYVVWEYNPLTEQKIEELEIGLMKVVGEVEETFLSIEPDEADDDYFIYPD